MRAVLVVTLCALLVPSAAIAQTAAPTTSARTRGGDISREEYVNGAVERARRAAEARFERMDANHDGVLTAAERRAARAARAQRRNPPSQ